MGKFVLACQDSLIFFHSSYTKSHIKELLKLEEDKMKCGIFAAILASIWMIFILNNANAYPGELDQNYQCHVCACVKKITGSCHKYSVIIILEYNILLLLQKSCQRRTNFQAWMKQVVGIILFLILVICTP